MEDGELRDGEDGGGWMEDGARRGGTSKKADTGAELSSDFNFASNFLIPWVTKYRSNPESSGMRYCLTSRAPFGGRFTGISALNSVSWRK
jgi:hypothetical protein